MPGLNFRCAFGDSNAAWVYLVIPTPGFSVRCAKANRFHNYRKPDEQSHHRVTKCTGS